MALPLLINGSDCGPSNPLQNFTKILDRDRGVTKDLFVSQRAGPSRETFRTVQQPVSPNIELEASRFFASQYAPSEFASPMVPTFNLSSLHRALPTSKPHTPRIQSPPAMQNQVHSDFSSWASEFVKVQEQRQPVLSPMADSAKVTFDQQPHIHPQPMHSQSLNPSVSQWMPTLHRSSSWAPVMRTNTQQMNAIDESLWDKEFQSQELSLQSAPVRSVSEPSLNLEKPGNLEADELARTAGLLVEAVRDEQNSKFKNSQFMGLMRQLRDGDVIVEGNDLVERILDNPSTETPQDVKGKGKQREIVTDSSSSLRNAESARVWSEDAIEMPHNAVGAARQRRKSVHFDGSSEQTIEEQHDLEEEDPNIAYFKQENDDYVNYWADSAQAAQTAFATTAPEWGALQSSWDSFEATATGIKEITHYSFQPWNPYLLGDSLRTRNHSVHSPLSLYESVLELEAEVQRDPLNVSAWFELGVKQQENEREPKAISALKRAIDLDPSYISAWLALAISHTNENQRTSADDAIEQWIARNQKYESTVANYRSSFVDKDGSSVFQSEKHAALIECLMAIARSGSGEIDADVQIALAVLLNSSDEFHKAQDCFRTALAVRPDDWQLYNRVGATMANSGDADGALQFYYRALELNPAYIRARFNLGISCINLKKYEEAAQHILDALVLQDSDGAVTGKDDKRGITSSALWESLKTTCLHLQRIDLASLCDQQDLDGLRREFNV